MSRGSRSATRSSCPSLQTVARVSGLHLTFCPRCLARVSISLILLLPGEMSPLCRRPAASWSCSAIRCLLGSGARDDRTGRSDKSHPAHHQCTSRPPDVAWRKARALFAGTCLRNSQVGLFICTVQLGSCPEFRRTCRFCRQQAVLDVECSRSSEDPEQ